MLAYSRADSQTPPIGTCCIRVCRRFGPFRPFAALQFAAQLLTFRSLLHERVLKWFPPPANLVDDDEDASGVPAWTSCSSPGSTFADSVPAHGSGGSGVGNHGSSGAEPGVEMAVAVAPEMRQRGDDGALTTSAEVHIVAEDAV